jgi:iron(III) transport system substrate-binding protein
VEAAKREGTLVLMGPQGADVRAVLTEGFQRKYPEITLEYDSGSGPQKTMKVTTEQAAGRYHNDLLVGGTSTIMELMPGGFLDPLLPYLVGPDNSDPTVWLGGKRDFADDAGRYNLIFGAYTSEAFFYNTSAVRDLRISSLWELLDPRWKGQIAGEDPTRQGAANGKASFAYVHPRLGPEFVRRMWGEHDVQLFSDGRQALDAVGRGRAAIGLGVSNQLVNDAVGKGLPIQLVDGHTMAEGTYLTSGAASLGVLKNPPHPNALKLYLNWFLSREGQATWVKGVSFASLRRDVPPENVPPVLVPREGVEYIQLNHERYDHVRLEALDFLKTVLRRS